MEGFYCIWRVRMAIYFIFWVVKKGAIIVLSPRARATCGVLETIVFLVE